MRPAAHMNTYRILEYESAAIEQKITQNDSQQLVTTLNRRKKNIMYMDMLVYVFLCRYTCIHICVLNIWDALFYLNSMHNQFKVEKYIWNLSSNMIMQTIQKNLREVVIAYNSNWQKPWKTSIKDFSEG